MKYSDILRCHACPSNKANDAEVFHFHIFAEYQETCSVNLIANLCHFFANAAI